MYYNYRMFTKNNLLKISFNTLIGGLAVAVWLYFVDLSDIIFRLKQANLWYLIPALLALICSIIVRSFKLKFFLSPIRKVNFFEILALNGVAGMLNFLIPIRAGEITKGFYLSKTYSIDLSKAVMWVFMDRFLDFLYILIVVPIILFFIPTVMPYTAIVVSMLVAGVLISVSYLMIYQVSISNRLFHVFTQLHTFELLYKHLLDAFSVLKRSFLDWLGLITLTTLAFIFDGLPYYFLFLSINSHQSVLNMFLGNLLSALSYIIPAAPGYVGSAEATGLLVFSGVLGIDKASSSAMILLFHSLVLISLVAGGIIGLYYLNLDIRTIFKKKLKVFRE